jgi:sulfite exporter TauE/SafE
MNPQTEAADTAPDPAAPSPTRRSVHPASLAALVLVGLLIALGASDRLDLPALPQMDASASLWLVFLTGLSVGGLSCLAVQGGLLATTIANRAVQLDLDDPKLRDQLLPVSLFLAAKLVAYTLLGAALGYFGSKIPVSVQAWLMIAVGLLMLAVVGQMYQLHPALRRISFTPPKSVQRLLRARSKQSSAGNPLALGAMTVFIPCGVTLAMEAVAIASNDPLRGAAIMAVFTLGTSPLFFLLGFVATRLSQTAFRFFRPLAALSMVLIAGLSMLSGARLLGLGGVVARGEVTEAQVSESIQEASIRVLSSSYSPTRIQVQAGLPTRLAIVDDGAEGCMTGFRIPSLDVDVMIEPGGTRFVDLPAQEPGQIDFMCSMGMFTGVVEVVQ